MWMELYVLSDRTLTSIAEWQESIDVEGFALNLATETPLAALNGVLPARLNGKPVAFECSHWSFDTLMAETPGVDFVRRWTCAFALRWNGNFDESVAAYMAASAYAKAAAGVVFDCEEGKIISPARAREIALDIEKGKAGVEALVQQALERMGRTRGA